MVDQEYNSFGPWIYEINDDYPLPPLFLPYYKEDRNYLMLIKIPRNIERRDAKPGMDLYDYVIGLYEDFIYILKRTEKLVETTKIFYRDIEGIESYIDLLLGRLTIYLKNTVIIIPYNAVSDDIIMRLMKIIRDRYAVREYSVNAKNISEENLKVDDLYITLLYVMKKTEQRLHIGAVQSTMIPSLSRNVSLWQRVKAMLFGEKLLNMLHLFTDKELIVIGRGEQIRNTYETIYSRSFLYIPIERINSIRFENSERYTSLQILTVKSGNNSFGFFFEESNEEFIYFYNNFKNSIEIKLNC